MVFGYRVDGLRLRGHPRVRLVAMRPSVFVAELVRVASSALRDGPSHECPEGVE